MVGVAALGVNIVLTIVTLAGLAGRLAEDSSVGEVPHDPSWSGGPHPALHPAAGAARRFRLATTSALAPTQRDEKGEAPNEVRAGSAAILHSATASIVQRTRHTMNKITHTVASIDSLEGRRQNRAQKSRGSRQNLPHGPRRSTVVSWTATMKKRSPRVLPAQASMLLTDRQGRSASPRLMRTIANPRLTWEPAKSPRTAPVTFCLVDGDEEEQSARSRGASFHDCARSTGKKRVAEAHAKNPEPETQEGSGRIPTDRTRQVLYPGRR
jgi:hypothetical protein